jgi:L-iditol 2-dehydrogenase
MGPGEETSVPLSVVQTGVTLTGSFRYAGIYPTAIVTDHFPLEEAERAMQAGRQDPYSVKAVVVPGG